MSWLTAPGTRSHTPAPDRASEPGVNAPRHRAHRLDYGVGSTYSKTIAGMPVPATGPVYWVGERSRARRPKVQDPGARRDAAAFWVVNLD